MPTVPVFAQQSQLPQRPSVRLGDFIPSAQGLSSGIDELGQILAQDRLRNDQTAVASADTARETWANTRLYDPTNGAFAREGANALGVTDQVLSDYDKEVERIFGGLTNRRQQLAYLQNAQAQRVAMQGQLARFESDQRGRYEDQTALSRMSTAIDSAALAYTDPATQATSRQALATVLADQKSRKGWDDTTFQAQRAATYSKLHEAVITNMLANRQVPLAQAYFNANQAELDATGRDAILTKIDATMRSEWADMERIQGLTDKQKKQAADAAAKVGDKLLSDGQLSARWIEQNTAVLDPADVRFFYDKLRNPSGEGPRNADLYANLRYAAGQGQDVRDDARSALHRGDIRSSDYSQILNEVETSHPNWYKRGADYIKSMSGVSLLNPPTNAPQLYARMIDQWGDWRDQNPNATDSQAQVAYQDIAAKALLVDLAALPPLKYRVGSDLQPDIEATKKATDAAFQRGELTPEQYGRQKDIILQYLRAMPKPAPKAPQ